MARRWEQWDDEKKFESPEECARHPKQLEPTITRARVVVERKIGQAIRNALAKMRLPVVAPPEYVLDGESVRVSLGEGNASCQFAWLGAAEGVEEVGAGGAQAGGACGLGIAENARLSALRVRCHESQQCRTGATDRRR